MAADVFLAVPPDTGWEPVRRMARLLSSYLGTELIELDTSSAHRTGVKLQGLVPRLPAARRTGIVIASDPGQLNAVLQRAWGVRGYGQLVGWVVDSFWDARIPRVARSRRIYDRVYVTDPADVAAWADRGVPEPALLPWGTDAWPLHARPRTQTPDIDLLRVGRQPAAWDDDARTDAVAAAHGLRFHGRPRFGQSPEESAENLAACLARARAVLAFGNLVSPAPYTHPEREYLTARWTDALAHGCVVVGRRPWSVAAHELLWPEATTDVDPQDLDRGMAQAAERLIGWDAEDRSRQAHRALSRLDWRLRFRTLFADLGLDSPALDRDLAAMAAHLKDHGLELETA